MDEVIEFDDFLLLRPKRNEEELKSRSIENLLNDPGVSIHKKLRATLDLMVHAKYILEKLYKSDSGKTIRKRWIRGWNDGMEVCCWAG